MSEHCIASGSTPMGSEFGAEASGMFSIFDGSSNYLVGATSAMQGVPAGDFGAVVRRGSLDSSAVTTEFSVANANTGSLPADLQRAVEDAANQAKAHGGSFKLVTWRDGVQAYVIFETAHETFSAQQWLKAYRGGVAAREIALGAARNMFGNPANKVGVIARGGR